MSQSIEPVTLIDTTSYTMSTGRRLISCYTDVGTATTRKRYAVSITRLLGMMLKESDRLLWTHIQCIGSSDVFTYTTKRPSLMVYHDACRLLLRRHNVFVSG